MYKMTLVPRFRGRFFPTMESNEKLAAVIFVAIGLEKGNNSGILEVLCSTASFSENGQSPVTPDPQLLCETLLEFKLIHFLSPVHLTSYFHDLFCCRTEGRSISSHAFLRIIPEIIEIATLQVNESFPGKSTVCVTTVDAYPASPSFYTVAN